MVIQKEGKMIFEPQWIISEIPPKEKHFFVLARGSNGQGDWNILFEPKSNKIYRRYFFSGVIGARWEELHTGLK